jgi:hypothetical protein
MAKWAGETLYRFGAGFTKLKNPMRASQKTDGKELFRSGVPRGAGISHHCDPDFKSLRRSFWHEGFAFAQVDVSNRIRL